MGKKVNELSEKANGNGIDVDSMLTIHRGQDGYIGFVRKNEDAFENLFSIRVEELQQMIPGLAKWLTKDSYFTVNSSYRAAPYESPITGLPSVWRKETQLRYLNACYCDFDCGRPNSPDQRKRMSWMDCYAQLHRRIEKGELLQPSIIAESGRGLYLFWLLVGSKESDLPVKAFFDKLAVYKAVNEAIAYRLEELAADFQSVDAARVLRVPGSVHTLAGRRAKYAVLYGQNRKPFLYTLEEVAQAFDVKIIGGVPQWIQHELPPKRRLRLTPKERRGTVPKRRAGYEKRYEKLARDIYTICQYEGGWTKGWRYRKLRLSADALLRAGLPFEAVVTATEGMAKECKPSFPTSGEANDIPIRELVQQVQSEKKRIVSRPRLVAIFVVTPELARKLELCYILPKEVLEEQRRPSKKEQIAKRREFIGDWVQHYHVIPTQRRMAEILAEYGIDVARRTIGDDYKALEYKT